MYLTENLQEKWQPVLEHPDLPKIEDSYKKLLLLLSWKTKKKQLEKIRHFYQKQHQQTLRVLLLTTGTQY